ncbi:tyrosine-type recombinase/integrase (plasmid) [Flavobacterium sp. CBA20B-1]|uniref:tyrosine-type recombinase/integrase n=1 Tax=unclassified Flavobacterium TaxID=196869 RepID=UPI002224C85D|nr:MULTISPECIES: tyrosine-type recombinase/integrase [unclassified Flavobacterium]WCM43606.1 tyrosine-type recombinase/integrase [Flavobacterium sp. CBA20B-1]
MNTTILPTESTVPALTKQLNFQHLIDAFINDQDVKETSKTCYRGHIKQFFIWIQELNYTLDKIERKDIILYKEHLLNKKMSSLTVAGYITIVRKFFEWAESHKLYPNIAKGIKLPRRKQQIRKQPLTSDQVKTLLETCSINSRDFAIINLLVRTGLRTIELVRLDIKDITFKSGKRIALIQGKGRDDKDNFVELTEKAYEPIQAYLKTRGKYSPSDPLFVSESKNSMYKRLSTRTIREIVKTNLKAMGIDDKNYTAHSLRHTVAVSILRAGGTPEMAQFALRHSNSNTTQIYTATLQEERRLQNSGERLLDSIY